MHFLVNRQQFVKMQLYEAIISNCVHSCSQVSKKIFMVLINISKIGHRSLAGYQHVVVFFLTSPPYFICSLVVVFFISSYINSL